MLWAPPAAIDGDGTLDHAGSACRLSLDLPDVHTGSTGHDPVSYYGLGVIGWRAGDHYYPPLALRWRDQILDGRPDDADGIYWQLGAGQGGDLEIGYEMVDQIQPSALVEITANQSIADNTITMIPWQVLTAGVGNIWSVAAPTRFTARVAGVYLLSAEVSCDAVAYSNLSLTVYFNGVFNVRMTKMTNMIAVGGAHAIAGCYIVSMMPNDYLEVSIFQLSGAARNLVALTKAQLIRLSAI